MPTLERPKAPLALTNGGTMFTGGYERTCQIGSELNDGAPPEELFGIEIYPIQDTLPIFGKSAGVSVEKIQACEQKYGVYAQRVHIEFAADEEERKWQASKANNQHNGSPIMVGFHKVLYEGVRDAQSGFGIDLARGLGVGLNAHTNVFLVFYNRGELERLWIEGQECLIENTIDYNIDELKPDILSAVSGDRRALYDPREIVRQLILGKKEFAKFDIHYARDHLTDYFDRQGVDPNEPAKDIKVQQRIRAVHLADRKHGFLRKDRSLAEFIHLMETSPDVPKPVQYVFDYSPIEMVKHARTLKTQVGVYRQSRRLVRELQQAVSWYEEETDLERRPSFGDFVNSQGIFDRLQVQPA